MGMAASQARYLALVARKSNCEYEGQQINQARLLLSNQTANLFNQMLGLTVPVPPSTQDFTTTQYSFSDGTHNYVIDSWKQLTTADPDYNYLVNAHYFTDVYTGSMKRMADPQVQLSNTQTSVATLEQIRNARAALKAAEDAKEERYNYWQLVKTAQEAQIEALRSAAGNEIGSQIVYPGLNVVSASDPASGGYGYDFNDGAEHYIAHIYDGTNGAIPTAAGSEPRKVLEELKNMIELGIIDMQAINQAMWDRDNAYEDQQLTDITQLDFNGTYTDLQKYLLDTYAYVTHGTDAYLALSDNLDSLHDVIDGGEMGVLSGYHVYNVDGSIGEDYLEQIEDCQALIDAAYQAYIPAKDNYDAMLEIYNSLCQPTYVGNCPLTYLDELTEEQSVELHQVVADMIAQGINTDITNCFDTYGNYLGGVYSFTMYGTTYYTTYNNLLDAYASETVSNNSIDAQYRMPYYNASYISTRVDEQAKALLETDGNGRFKSIRFENDSATYTLNMETVTDDVAYEDAMNKYYYENALYDKKVQDINAKTSIIQREDQELELRLKQLDTEQNALKTEIDAVSKIVKDNVEASFKTFGG